MRNAPQLQMETVRCHGIWVEISPDSAIRSVRSFKTPVRVKTAARASPSMLPPADRVDRLVDQIGPNTRVFNYTILFEPERFAGLMDGDDLPASDAERSAATASSTGVNAASGEGCALGGLPFWASSRSLSGAPFENASSSSWRAVTVSRPHDPISPRRQASVYATICVRGCRM